MPSWPNNRPPRLARKRRYNLRLVKATWPYTAQEIAELFGVHKNAVFRWLKEGLHADLSQKPYLIRGDELVGFLKQRQDGRRRRCAPHEFFCFKCRLPREVCLGMADIVIESPSRLRLSALCGICETPVNKLQSARDLVRIQTRFHVQQLTGEHILECADASLNRDLET